MALIKRLSRARPKSRGKMLTAKYLILAMIDIVFITFLKIMLIL